VADITSTAFGCGGPNGSGLAEDLTGQAGWLLVSLNAGTAPTWVTDADFDDGFAVDLNSTDQQVVTYDASGVTDPDKALALGSYLNDMIFAVQFKLDAIGAIEPIFVASDDDNFDRFVLWVDETGRFSVSELGDSGYSGYADVVLVADTVYDVAVSRYNVSGVTVEYAISINGTVYTPVTAFGVPQNGGSGYTVNATNGWAALGGPYIVNEYDEVEDVYVDVPYRFNGRISRYEQFRVGAPMFTRSDPTYSYTYYSCASDPTDFWQGFRSTVETTP